MSVLQRYPLTESRLNWYNTNYQHWGTRSDNWGVWGKWALLHLMSNEITMRRPPIKNPKLIFPLRTPYVDPFLKNQQAQRTFYCTVTIDWRNSKGATDNIKGKEILNLPFHCLKNYQRLTPLWKVWTQDSFHKRPNDWLAGGEGYGKFGLGKNFFTKRLVI